MVPRLDSGFCGGCSDVHQGTPRALVVRNPISGLVVKRLCGIN